MSKVRDSEQVELKLAGAQIFSNYLSLKKQMDLAIKEKNNLVINLKNTTFIDHTVMDHLDDYSRNLKLEGKELTFINIENLNPVSDHPLAARTKQTQALHHPHLSQRSQKLITLAENMGGEFTLRQKYGISSQFEYPFFMGKKVTDIVNIIKIESLLSKLMLADVYWESGAEMTLETHSQTVMVITDMGFDIPDFSLRKEDWVDHLLEKGGWNDIDIEESPDFSQQFYLKGENPTKIRDFFQPHIIEWFNIHPDCQFESNKGNILLYYPLKTLDEDDLQKLIKMGETLSAMISKVFTRKGQDGMTIY